MHDHEHHHHHHHHPVPGGAHLTRAFRLGIWLNLIYVIVEAAFGFISGSMGLLSDAGHNLSDVASLIIALIAFRATRLKPNSRFTYGYGKATVVASVVNAVILYVAVAFILYESVRKLFTADHVEGGMMIWVAAIGVVINGFTAWLFMKDSRHDINVKGAFLHMAADTLVSVGVVLAGVVIYFTGWVYIDPIIGICIALMIAFTSWSMLRESLRLAFDGVPGSVDIDKVREAVLALPTVKSEHHLHIWAISTTETAMTVHVVVDKTASVDDTILAVREAVSPLGITHTTVEVETSDLHCQHCGHNH